MNEIIAVVLMTITLICFVFALIITVSLFNRVPFVPSRSNQIERMVKLADIKKTDKVADLGCGDGKILFFIEKNTKATYLVGYENKLLPILCYWLKRLFRPKTKVILKSKDFFKEDLSKYNKVFLYLFPFVMEKLLPKLKKELPKGAIVISNTFDFKKKKPEKVIDITDPFLGKTNIYVYRF